MTPAMTRSEAVSVAIQFDNHRDYTGDFDLCLHVRDGNVYGVVSDPFVHVTVSTTETLTPDEGGTINRREVTIKQKSPKRVKE